jgi:energy-coupling factor transporter transmembrane protein EcfT
MNLDFQRMSLGRFFVGVVLVGLGVVLLLTSFEVIIDDFWRNLVTFWPVLIIGFGATVLLRSYNRVLGPAVLGALVAGSIAAAAVTSALGIDLPGLGDGF